MFAVVTSVLAHALSTMMEELTLASQRRCAGGDQSGAKDSGKLQAQPEESSRRAAKPQGVEA